MFLPPAILILASAYERGGIRREIRNSKSEYRRKSEIRTLNSELETRNTELSVKSELGTPNSELTSTPYATNAFYYEENGLRILSIDWAGLTSGRIYELQFTTDGRTWSRRARTLWSDPEPASYWRTQTPMLPPTPAGLSSWEYFRLKETQP